jgi:hypothetical protein
MKRSFQTFLVLILLSGAFYFSSCKGKDATTGTLSITAMTSTGAVSTTTPVGIHLATSKANLDNNVYVATGWLNANGSYIFRDLTPKFYWYNVDGWNDYGASDVYAGIDESVILWLNSPSSSK